MNQSDKTFYATKILPRYEGMLPSAVKWSERETTPFVSSQHFMLQNTHYVIIKETVNPGLWHDAHRFEYDIVPCGHVQFLTIKTMGNRDGFYMLCKQKEARDVTYEKAELKSRLLKFIAYETQRPIDEIAAMIVGSIFAAHNTTDLYSNDPTVQRIGDLASDLEISNGTDNELNIMWNKIKRLVNNL